MYVFYQGSEGSTSSGSAPVLDQAQVHAEGKHNMKAYCNTKTMSNVSSIEGKPSYRVQYTPVALAPSSSSSPSPVPVPVRTPSRSRTPAP